MNNCWHENTAAARIRIGHECFRLSWRAPHTRKHGPYGYATYSAYRPWLRDEFTFRYVYCLAREQWGRVSGEFGVDHFTPQAKSPDQALDYANLLYCCQSCNALKGSNSR